MPSGVADTSRARSALYPAGRDLDEGEPVLQIALVVGGFEIRVDGCSADAEFGGDFEDLCARAELLRNLKIAVAESAKRVLWVGRTSGVSRSSRCRPPNAGARRHSSTRVCLKSHQFMSARCRVTGDAAALDQPRLHVVGAHDFVLDRGTAGQIERNRAIHLSSSAYCSKTPQNEKTARTWPASRSCTRLHPDLQGVC